MRKLLAQAPNAAALLLALLIAAFFCGRALTAAYPLWVNADEELGITEAIDDPVPGLLAGKMLEYELNTSPLHYLVDKAWLNAAGGWLRHSTPSYFFRVPSILWFSTYVVLFILLFYRLSGQLGLPAPVRLIFAGGVGLTLITNSPLLYGVALQDRPYALWILLGAIQLTLLYRWLGRKERGPSPGLALNGILLSMNTFAAGSQVALASLVRWLARPRAERSYRIFLEAAPGLMLAGWYFLHRHEQGMRGAHSFFGLWWNALTSAALHRSRPAFDMTADVDATTNPGLFAAFWVVLCFLLPLVSRRPILRSLYYYCLLVVAAGVPTTAGAVLFANYLEPRYFFYLYPSIVALQFLGVLALADWLMARQKLLGPAVLVLWALGQLIYRQPHLADDLRAFEVVRANPPYRSEPAENCPADFGSLRYPPLNRVHTAKLRELCR